MNVGERGTTTTTTTTTTGEPSSNPIINNAKGEMFKLAGRHEWEAWTKGKWNISSERVGGKEDERGDLVPARI